MPTTALHHPTTPVQLSLVGSGPAPSPSQAPLDAVAWQIGFDHARSGQPLPTAHLHAGSPLFEGWQAALAQRRTRHRDPAPATCLWLSLRLRAWTEGVAFEDQLLTPHYLQQLAASHCPVLRVPLHDEQGHPAQRRIERLRQGHAYAAGHLITLSETAARALRGRNWQALHALQALAQKASCQSDPLEGLDAAAWARLAALVAMVTPGARLGSLCVLPSNRLHLRHPILALQAWVSRQLVQPGWSQRLAVLHDALANTQARHAVSALCAALAPHALELIGAAANTRWLLEDLWQVARVQRRWSALADALAPIDVERLLDRLPPPPGWVLEHHRAAFAF